MGPTFAFYQVYEKSFSSFALASESNLEQQRGEEDFDEEENEDEDGMTFFSHNKLHVKLFR